MISYLRNEVCYLSGKRIVFVFIVFLVLSIIAFELVTSIVTIERMDEYRFVNESEFIERSKSELFFSFQEAPEQYKYLFDSLDDYKKGVLTGEDLSISIGNKQLYPIYYNDSDGYSFFVFYEFKAIEKLFDGLYDRCANVNIKYQTIEVGIVYCENENELQNFCSIQPHRFVVYENIFISPLGENYYLFEMKSFE